MKKSIPYLIRTLKYDRLRFQEDPEYKNLILQSILLIMTQY